MVTRIIDRQTGITVFICQRILWGHKNDIYKTINADEHNAGEF